MGWRYLPFPPQSVRVGCVLGKRRPLFEPGFTQWALLCAWHCAVCLVLCSAAGEQDPMAQQQRQTSGTGTGTWRDVVGWGRRGELTESLPSRCPGGEEEHARWRGQGTPMQGHGVGCPAQNSAGGLVRHSGSDISLEPGLKPPLCATCHSPSLL